MTQRPANVSSAPSPNQDGWTAQPDGSESGRDRHPGRFQPMARAMVKWLRAMVKLPQAMVKLLRAMVNCRIPALAGRITKSLASSADPAPVGEFRPFPAWNRQFRPACSGLRIPKRSFEKKEQRFPGTPVSGPEITREPWSNRPEPWSIGGAMVKPAEQWSIRTPAARAIESGLDGALTEVIAKLPRRLVAELTGQLAGQLAGQRIADPPAWASSSALGPVHAPRSGYSSPRMAFN